MVTKILVVDDDKSTRRLMQAILEAENYTVSLAENRAKALDVMEREHIDLVILDIMMPEMDGYSFTRTLRAANSDLPVLMVSAKQLTADRKEGYLAGTDDFMTKPVDGEELLLHVKALLRLATLYNVPTAVNRSTAEFLISSPLFEDDDYHSVVKDYREYDERVLK